MSRNNDSLPALIGTLLLILGPFLLWGGLRVVNYVQYKQNFGDNLKRAADANTVELAAEELETALKYIKSRSLTSGYTSVVVRTPDEDVGFWYKNLDASLFELKAVKPETSQLERTNLLMKLRETLLDKSKGSEEVTTPEGISVFPNNSAYAFLFVGSLAWMVLFGWWFLKDA